MRAVLEGLIMNLFRQHFGQDVAAVFLVALPPMLMIGAALLALYWLVCFVRWAWQH